MSSVETLSSIILTPVYYIACLIVINFTILGFSYPIILLAKSIFMNNGWMIFIFGLYATSETNLTLFVYSVAGIYAILNVIICTTVFSIFYMTGKHLRHEIKKNKKNNIELIDEEKNDSAKKQASNHEKNDDCNSINIV